MSFTIMKRVLLLMIIVALISCQKSTHKDVVPIHDTFMIESKILDENRVITTWLPQEYKINQENNYPVLYMLDGGVKEDFPHIANTLEKLIKQGEIAPLLLVGIENTVRRRDLTGASSVKTDAEVAPIEDGAKVFRRFIKKELIPEVNKRYRTTKQKAIVGESVAGLFVVETMLKQVNMFDIYIAIDPSLWWNNHNLVEQAKSYLKGLPNTSVKLWFAGSDAEDIFVYTEQLNQKLESHAPKNLSWVYLPQPKEQHNTIFRATKEMAFKWSLWK